MRRRLRTAAGLLAAAGTVSSVDNEGADSYGQWIEINHGGGYRTRCAHLSSQQVSVGRKVAQGKQIGKAGATGGVSGPHLHYEQILNGVASKVGAKTYTSSCERCG